MKIVIDIDGEDCKRIQDISDVFNSLTSRAYSAIRKGTPLPKVRGRLLILSENRLKENQINLDWSCQKWISEVGLSNATVAIIKEAKSESCDACSDLCTVTADVPNFESEEYIEKRVENYTKMLKSGTLDFVKDDIGMHDSVGESEG